MTVVSHDNCVLYVFSYTVSTNRIIITSPAILCLILYPYNGSLCDTYPVNYIQAEMILMSLIHGNQRYSGLKLDTVMRQEPHVGEGPRVRVCYESVSTM